MSPPVKPSVVGKEIPLVETREDAVRFIGQMAGELETIANRQKLDVLAYLLSMVKLEAMR